MSKQSIEAAKGINADLGTVETFLNGVAQRAAKVGDKTLTSKVANVQKATKEAQEYVKTRIVE